MKKICSIILMAVTMCVLFLSAGINNIAFAEVDCDLHISESKCLGMISKKVSNIENYSKNQERKKKSKISIAYDIFEALSYSDDEIAKFSEDELLYALGVVNIEVKRYIIEVDSKTGEQYLRDSVPQDLVSQKFDEILSIEGSNDEIYSIKGSNDIVVSPDGTVTDVKSNSWLQITSVFYQDSQYNATREEELTYVRKDGSTYTYTVDVVERYGYKCDFTFKWLSNPLWRSAEELGIAWSSDGVLVSGSDYGVYKNKGSVSYGYSYTAGMQLIQGYETKSLDFEINGINGRSLKWNLPSNLSEIYFGGFEYKLGVILQSSKDFNILASYAHRTFGAGGLGINIGPVSISYTATYMDVFSPGIYLVDVPTID